MEELQAEGKHTEQVGLRVPWGAREEGVDWKEEEEGRTSLLGNYSGSKSREVEMN